MPTWSSKPSRNKRYAAFPGLKTSSDRVLFVQIIDKMEAAGLIEPVHTARVLRFNFEDVGKLPPPIIAFSDVAFSYDGDMKNALYKDLSIGVEYVLSASIATAR